MTKKEIFIEMKECEKRVRQLQKEIMAETDHSIAMNKIDEMISIAKRMSELDTLNKKYLLKECKSETKNYIKSFMKMLFKKDKTR